MNTYTKSKFHSSFLITCVTSNIFFKKQNKKQTYFFSGYFREVFVQQFSYIFMYWWAYFFDHLRYFWRITVVISILYHCRITAVQMKSSFLAHHYILKRKKNISIIIIYFINWNINKKCIQNKFYAKV